MPTQDTSEIKNKIISFLRRNGPSLPVHIAREIESNILFTSAFLSEIVSEKRAKMSNMKVGNSSLYFLPGQENLLEKFSYHLKSKEKEAYSLLKERKILKDSEQDPAIRVALRELKDFAIPFKENEEIFWRFFNVPEKAPDKEKPEYKDKKIPEMEAEKPVKEPVKKQVKDGSLDIFDKTKKIKKQGKKKRKKIQQKESDFFKKIKLFLSENSMDFLDVLNFNEKEIMLRVRGDGKEKILIAYNKKRINEDDIIKASKKTNEFNLPYIILSKGELLKKTRELIEALKNLHSLKKVK